MAASMPGKPSSPKLSLQQQASIKQFFNALRDRPLDPEDPFYVPYLEEHPEDDYISFLAAEIRLSEVAGVILLSGHRGTGKSTELRRLQRYLEEQDCVVLLSNMLEYMNMTTPVELTDFFISIMGALAEEVERRYGENVLEERYWQRIADFLQTEVQLKEITASWGWAQVKASLKEDTSFRQQLQEGMRGHVARLIRKSHDFAGEMVTFIRERERDPDKKVVFLLDSIEQIRGVGVKQAELVYQSVENLFSGHASSLRLPLLHVVYTIPPWLPALAPNLGSNLGTIHTLPSIHICDFKSREPDPKGLSIMERIVEARCADWQQIFTREQLHRMALNTGGDLREFLHLIKQCLTQADATRVAWPIPDSIIERGESNMRRNMLPIAEQDADWLRRITTSHEDELQAVQQLPSLARFFDTKLVLKYRNGSDWYDVHPLIRDVLGATSS